ncbi:MAG: D-alanyl-D-alanine carboxypeptidase [Candidatus Roizmanbacteria bacterium]|nr:MAG: D-alanyl-D-alanine carboxypeptidase [Candidatus Roizmanbacteria bacterium]
MKLRGYLLLIFFSLLFLFYPGDSEYFKTFAYNKELFSKNNTPTDIKILPVPYIKAPYYPNITAEGAYILDLLSFTPVFEKNVQTTFFPASTTKIITALVAYDIFKSDDNVTIKRIINEGQSMGLVTGEKISVENLLYGVLVHSGNDAAFALADYYEYDKFVKLMNKKAQSLGMKNSYFKNPAGLDETGQITTAYDLSLAARELLKNKYLSKITSTKEIVISDADFNYFHKLVNVNKLLGEVQGIGGLKTGYTESAGENLISFYKKNGHQFIIIVLKSSDRFKDTKEIVKWIGENVDYLNL